MTGKTRRVLDDKHFMRLAVAKAQAGIRVGQTPFGACIVKSGRVVSLAHNVVWRTTDITAHAEMTAIRLACRKLKTIDLSGCVMYSTCEPCPMCFSACHWARIDRIVYGCSIRDAQRGGFNELAVSAREMKRRGKSPVRIQTGCLLKDNQQLFARWAGQKSRRVY